MRGLEARQFPISIGIKGSPVEIPLGQVGISYLTSPPTLPIPTQIVRTEPISKLIKLKNTGIRGVEVDWKVFDS